VASQLRLSHSPGGRLRRQALVGSRRVMNLLEGACVDRSVFLALGGGLATAVAFGPARVGYGLFLPRFREAFSLSQSSAGLIASLGFAGFFVALIITGWLVSRHSARLPVVLGSVSALLGLVIVAVSQNTLMLAIGVGCAATSAGFCWTPFNNAAERSVPETKRGRTLSIISTGTTVGIGFSGALALAVAGLTQGWRVVWLVFAFTALVSALINGWAMRRMPYSPNATRSSMNWAALVVPMLPLYGIAWSFGVTNSIYLSFAVQHVSETDGLAGVRTNSAGPILYVALGIGGLIGLATADLEQRFGLTALVRVVFLCSFISLGVLGWYPAAWWSVLVSAALQGACVMILSSIFAFWSERLYPGLPTVSLTAVLVVFAAGNIIGPVAAGYTADATSLAITFLGVACISLATAVLFPGRTWRQQLARGTS